MKPIQLKQILEVLHFKTTIKLIIVDDEYDEVCKKEYGVGNNEYIIISNAFSIKKNLSHLLSLEVEKIDVIVTTTEGGSDYPVLVIKIRQTVEITEK
ncbi:hypothetical protein [uncultured Clostridium sp.]|uniref:hypothetical protein n=1 Tax=uncultured Clostridium sp. TaxID=59620 RepID=UPI00263A5BBC|nr:hypothetical protein [uncultured Clostridium sp.]